MTEEHTPGRSRFSIDSLRTVTKAGGFTLIELMAVVAVAAVAVTLTFSLGPSLLRQYRWSNMVRGCQGAIEMARMRAIARGGGFVTIEFRTFEDVMKDSATTAEDKAEFKGSNLFEVVDINPAYKKGISDGSGVTDKAYRWAQGRSDQIEFRYDGAQFYIQVDPPSYFPYRATGAVLSFEGCGSSPPSQTSCWKTPCDCRTSVDGLVFGARGAQRDWVDRKIMIRAFRPGTDLQRRQDFTTEIILNGMGTLAQGKN